MNPRYISLPTFIYASLPTFLKCNKKNVLVISTIKMKYYAVSASMMRLISSPGNHEDTFPTVNQHLPNLSCIRSIPKKQILSFKMVFTPPA